MTEPINPYPLNPTRSTAEAMRADALAMTDEIQNLLDAQPTPAQWQAIESCALRIASSARKGRCAAVLVQTANEAQAARVEQHETAMTVQLDRMGMSETAGRLHPIFEDMIHAAGMQ